MNVNQKELANILGITSRRVRQLREEGFFSFAENGKKYSLEKCVQEYIEYKVKAETNTGTSIDREKEQAEHEQIKKNISKLKLRKLKKELHEASDVELFLSEMLINFRNRLLSIPSKVAVQILGEEDINRIIEILQKEMYETLEELSEYNPDKINREKNYDSDEDYEEDDED
ncbi:UNVERIFIED_ORG: DNA-packaging protein [Clostridium botulinum]|uniref:DNA-packaging protein n=1 Tax=unclassified Clostridium TaxID=2614128 RepID=UPI000A17524E|nr:MULTISPECIES: DNA-packaging protein [unclassified Clostridium]NFG24832.1 DNA-packaging protein [Clostridium botulinum]NFH90872.1 DNA-packaging protein [Clostridium botulinum]NFI17310.1 DNA-packaging protein [Clostridium botulinum]NFL92113.1 DNA-packaging protein [Clostridium botulinum]NFN52113.1 DNA-packaging protein [Clostridium botulinum]